MKIRMKNMSKGEKEKFVYEIDDEKGNFTVIDAIYLELAMRILDMTSKRMTLKNAKAFKKFVTNIKRATRYFDKMEKRVIETPNIIHNQKESEKALEYHEKYVKYDKKAKSLFSLHNGWYENFILIMEEIEKIIKGSFNNIKDLDDDNVEVFYTASRIDMILEKYKKKQNSKTL